MKTYTIHGRPFELDETKRYMDFFLTAGMPNLVEIDFEEMLSRLASGAYTLDHVEEEMVFLDRWVAEAPRKRFYRGLVTVGVTVVSGEEWFAQRDDGEEIIHALENTGHVARRFLEAFLPELAERCKKQPHPASVAYIDPSV